MKGTDGPRVAAGHASTARARHEMATEKHRGAPKKQVKKQSAAAKAKQAKKLAARTGGAPQQPEPQA
jgi:hypothetical protein